MNEQPSPFNPNQPPTPTFQKFPSNLFWKKTHPIQNTMPSCEMTPDTPTPTLGTLGTQQAGGISEPKQGVAWVMNKATLWAYGLPILRSRWACTRIREFVGLRQLMKKKIIPKNHEISKLVVWYNWPALRITGPCYRGVWMCIAGVWDLQSANLEIPSLQTRKFLGWCGCEMSSHEL